MQLVKLCLCFIHLGYYFAYRCGKRSHTACHFARAVVKLLRAVLDLAHAVRCGSNAVYIFAYAVAERACAVAQPPCALIKRAAGLVYFIKRRKQPFNVVYAGKVVFIYNAGHAYERAFAEFKAFRVQFNIKAVLQLVRFFYFKAFRKAGQHNGHYCCNARLGGYLCVRRKARAAFVKRHHAYNAERHIQFLFNSVHRYRPLQRAFALNLYSYPTAFAGYLLGAHLHAVKIIAERERKRQFSARLALIAHVLAFGLKCCFCAVYRGCFAAKHVFYVGKRCVVRNGIRAGHIGYIHA